MNQKNAKTIYRKNYQASGFVIDSLSLRFELEESETRVTNTMSMQNLDVGKPLVLMGEDLELLTLTLNGKTLSEQEYRVDGESVIIEKTPANFELEIRTRINPKGNTQLSGLYRTNDLFCTQCEAEGFRRITYFLDRPDVLTTYKTTIVAEEAKFPVLLSNGNLIDKGSLDGGRHWVTWEDPFKKPSYLFALVAGDLAFVEDTFTTMSGRKVILRIFVEHGNESKCDHAMQSLKKAMKWDEDVYGREYDLDIFMIVAVSDFNMGAMENKGLNIFNAKYILARPESATDADFAGIEGVVAHEYFHNWTGNRVTCRDWFQLSLKEGLTVFRDQEFSRDMNSRDVNRIGDVKLLRSHQFPEDAGPMAHPVRPDEYIEINNFYTATVYNKGAEVIRMQHTCLGAEGFRKGMDLYFERHDGQAVTIDDFVLAMEEANDVDFTQLKRWYSQAGTPEVSVNYRVEANTLILQLSQYCSPTPGQEEKLPFYIPIKLALFSLEGKRYDIGEDIIVLNEEKQEFSFNNIEEGAVVSLLRDFSAPIKLHISQSEANLRVLIHNETDGFARFEAMQQLLKQTMFSLIEQKKKGETLSLSESVLNVIALLLDDQTMNLALKAQLLQPLTFEAVISDMKDIDVQDVVDAMDFFTKEVGVCLQDTLTALYASLNAQASNAMDCDAFAIRDLKNVCLGYLSETGKHWEVVESQFRQAKTMTDELSAFHLLMDASPTLSNDAVTSFYSKWAEDDLVLDKWFAIQAMSKKANTLAQVIDLMDHKAFHVSNPNKVRALVGSFIMGNARHFHSQEGYQFLVDVILKVDKLNPQTAARLVVPLTRWRRYSLDTREQMKASLMQLSQEESLSKDVFEVVSKSLV